MGNVFCIRNKDLIYPISSIFFPTYLVFPFQLYLFSPFYTAFSFYPDLYFSFPFYLFPFLKNSLFHIGVWPTSNVVILSGGQQRDSVIRVHVFILPQTPLPSRLPHNIEQSSLCCAIVPCWLSILNKQCGPVHSKLPNYHLPYPPYPSPPRQPVSSFSKSVNLFLFCT